MRVCGIWISSLLFCRNDQATLFHPLQIDSCVVLLLLVAQELVHPLVVTISKITRTSVHTVSGPVIYLFSDQKKDERMGQSASRPGSEDDKRKWKQGKKTVLCELLDCELVALLQGKPLTLEEIRHVGRSIQRRRQAPHEGYYAQDADAPEAQLAARLNAANKGLARQRFLLVPSRLKEPIFWEATIALVQERLVEHNARCQLELEEPRRDRATNAILREETSSIPDDQRIDEKVEETLYSKLALKDYEVSALKQQVNELQQLLLTTSSSSSSTTFQKQPSHKGNWIMEKDSVDFLEYPDDIKTNMRSEKKRRLRQIRNDMKFILDSDNLEDTNGHWDCCGAQEYQLSCGFPQENGE
jgi:hypothetical protein